MDRQASSGPDASETRWKTIRGRVFFWLGGGEGAGELATCGFCPFIQRYMGRALRLGPFFRKFCHIDRRRRRRRSRFRVGNRQVISKKKKYPRMINTYTYIADHCTLRILVPMYVVLYILGSGRLVVSGTKTHPRKNDTPKISPCFANHNIIEKNSHQLITFD